MNPSLQSLLAGGTKLWLDSVDPDLLAQAVAEGVTGATSNPVIIAELISSGRFDGQLRRVLSEEPDDEAAAWRMTDQLVRRAQQLVLPVWRRTAGDDGYVSFEVDPLLEDPAVGLDFQERVARYVELARRWSAGQENRMIKVPATEAGLAALTPLAAAGVTLNVTLLFTLRQYRRAREAVWRGAQQRPDGLDRFKSVYSVFVSRIDAYTRKHVPELQAAQGWVGVANAKRIWADNEAYWRDKGTRLRQEIVFASTGVKDPADPPWKYVEALAGGDIQTNPPATHRAAAESGRTFAAALREPTPPDILRDIDAHVDFDRLEQVLMEEGVAKFVAPQRRLLELVADRRRRRGESAA